MSAAVLIVAILVAGAGLLALAAARRARRHLAAERAAAPLSAGAGEAAERRRLAAFERFPAVALRLDGDSRLLEANAPARERFPFLRPGLAAMVKLSAYDFSIYGGFEGTVEHISADAIVDERPGSRAESYYLVRVRTQHGSHGAGDKRLKILPGMQATVDIRTGRKTVLQYLLKPILRAKQTALRER